MTAMKAEVLSLLNIILASPSSNAELITSLVLAVITCIITLSIAGKLMKAGSPDYFRALVVVVAALVALPAIASSNIWLIPHLGKAGTIASIVLAVIIVLALAVPTCRFLLDTKFSTSFMIVLLAAGAAAIVIVFSHTGFDSVRAGKKDIDKMKQRQGEANQLK